MSKYRLQLLRCTLGVGPARKREHLKNEDNSSHKSLVVWDCCLEAETVAVGSLQLAHDGLQNHARRWIRRIVRHDIPNKLSSIKQCKADGIKKRSNYKRMCVLT